MPGPMFEKVASGWTYSANERFRGGRRVRLVIGALLSVAAHVVPFVYWPDWISLTRPVAPKATILEIEWLSILEGASELAGAEAPLAEVEPGRPLDTLADSLPLETGPLSDGDGTAVTVAWTFRERLTGGLSPVPTIVEQAGYDAADGDVGGVVNDTAFAIRERELSTADFETLAELGADPMGLDRLSAVRPELALSMPAAWVLLRNPIEVEQFIQRSYRSGDLSRGANGMVSVALWIDERGSVEWAEISESSGRSDLDRVALALFSEVAAFRPARDQGVAVPRSVIFSVRFPWY